MSEILLARREARRRKILENSDSRLKRITGENQVIENSGNLQVEENGFVNVKEEVLPNGLINHERRNNLNISSIPLTTKEGSDSEETLNFRPFEGFPRTTEVTQLDELSSLEIYASQKSRNYIFISMALVFRLLVECNCHCISINSMVVTFLLTECGVLGVYGRLIPENSRYLGSLLLLSGISKNKIRLFILYLGTLYSALREFALYTFVFVSLEMCINIFNYL